MKILVCEDELIIAAFLKETCEQLGHTVVATAGTKAEALAAAATHLPEMALLDINLEGNFEGIEIARHFAGRYGIPFVFITAYSDADTLNRAVAVNPMAYLVKPVSKELISANLKLAQYRISAEKKPDLVANIDTGAGMHRVNLSKLVYIESFANYIELVFDTGEKEVVRMPLSRLEASLPDEFVRIHKSYLIHRYYLNGITAGRAIVGSYTLPVGRAFRKNLEIV